MRFKDVVSLCFERPLARCWALSTPSNRASKALWTQKKALLPSPQP